MQNLLWNGPRALYNLAAGTLKAASSGITKMLGRDNGVRVQVTDGYDLDSDSDTGTPKPSRRYRGDETIRSLEDLEFSNLLLLEALDAGNATWQAPPERLVSNELVLSRWRHTYISKMHVMERASLPGPPPWALWMGIDRSEMPALEIVTDSVWAWDESRRFEYAIISRDHLIGGIGMMPCKGCPATMELSIWLAPGIRGEQTAARAAVMLACAGFDLGALYVRMQIEETDDGRAAIAGRAGFVCVGLREPIETRPDLVNPWMLWHMDHTMVDGEKRASAGPS